MRRTLSAMSQPGIEPKANKENKEPFNLAKSTLFATLRTVLSVFKEVAGKTGVPGLPEGASALMIIFGAMQVCLIAIVTTRCSQVSELVRFAEFRGYPQFY